VYAGLEVWCAWKCENCGHIHEPQSKRMMCYECGHNDMDYEEISFNYNGLTAHLDMLTKLPGRHKKFLVWEFKTTNEFNVANPERFLPYAKHRIQAETYCVMLKELFNIDAVGYTIVYLNRNSSRTGRGWTPFAWDMTPGAYAARKKFLHRTINRYRRGADFLVAPSIAKLDELIAKRPCKTIDDYMHKRDGMNLAFFAEDRCPFIGNKGCRVQDFKEEILDLLPQLKSNSN